MVARTSSVEPTLPLSSPVSGRTMRAAQAAARRRRLITQERLLLRFQPTSNRPRIPKFNPKPDLMMVPFFPASVDSPRKRRPNATTRVLAPHGHGQQLRSVGLRPWMPGSVELAVRHQRIPLKGYRLRPRNPSHPPRAATRSDASHSQVLPILMPGVPSMGPALPPWRCMTRSLVSAPV